MAISSELVGSLGGGSAVAVFDFPSAMITGRWINNRININDSLRSDTIGIVSNNWNGLQLPPGNYAIGWQYGLTNDDDIPPAGLQTWMQISNNDRRYAMVTSDPSFDSRLYPGKNRMVSSSYFNWRASAGQLLQFWVCSGTGHSRPSQAGGEYGLVIVKL